MSSPCLVGSKISSVGIQTIFNLYQIKFFFFGFKTLSVCLYLAITKRVVFRWILQASIFLYRATERKNDSQCFLILIDSCQFIKKTNLKQLVAMIIDVFIERTFPEICKYLYFTKTIMTHYMFLVWYRSYWRNL